MDFRVGGVCVFVWRENERKRGERREREKEEREGREGGREKGMCGYRLGLDIS